MATKLPSGTNLSSIRINNPSIHSIPNLHLFFCNSLERERERERERDREKDTERDRQREREREARPRLQHLNRKSSPPPLIVSSSSRGWRRSGPRRSPEAPLQSTDVKHAAFVSDVAATAHGRRMRPPPLDRGAAAKSTDGVQGAEAWRHALSMMWHQ